MPVTRWSATRDVKWTSRSRSNKALDYLSCQAHGSRTSSSLLVVERGAIVVISRLSPPNQLPWGVTEPFSDILRCEKLWERLSHSICFATQPSSKMTLFYSISFVYIHTPEHAPFQDLGTVFPIGYLFYLIGCPGCGPHTHLLVVACMHRNTCSQGIAYHLRCSKPHRRQNTTMIHHLLSDSNVALCSHHGTQYAPSRGDSKFRSKLVPGFLLC